MLLDTTAYCLEPEISSPAADRSGPLRSPSETETPAHGVTAEQETAFQGETAARILIQPTAVSGDRGQWYRVHYAGAVLIERTWNPEFDAARALAAQGVTGRVEVWRGGRTAPDAAFVVEKLAKLTISETEQHEPRVVPWRPFGLAASA
jgi:hypothetical protein